MAQLTAALDDLLRSGEKRERLGAEGQKQLHRRFDVKIGIDQLEKLFDDRG